MSTLENYQQIPKDTASNDDLDFQYLKQTGILYLQSMGGGLWSDYNDHDPGVTTLEMLSYAITDLGARLDLPMQDLLASEADPTLSKQFYRAEEILPSCPVNALDYRKLFIDVDGVRNAWILPYEQLLHINCQTDQLGYFEFHDINALDQTSKLLQGLNCILVDYDTDWIEENGSNTIAVNKAITSTYNANRNLCEDLVEIKEVEDKPISVCADINIKNTADEDYVHAQILAQLEDYFTPRIRRYSLKDMLDKGYRTDEIFEGPLLTKGFIDTEELKNSNLRSEVRLSDVVRIIMGVEGVISIGDISIQGCQNTEGNDWLICLEPFQKPKFAPTKDEEIPEDSDCDLQSVFTYRKEAIPVAYNYANVLAFLQEIADALEDANELAAANMLLEITPGRILDVGETTTIQNDYPETYGIGPYGLPPTSTTERRAYALQLKGYLLFFDQVLATYFAHLGKVKDLFSMDAGNAPTYFTQAVKDIKDFDKIVDATYPTNDDDALSQLLIDDANLDDNVSRRNEILDHLLARFAERFSEYTFLMKQLYGATWEEDIIDTKEQFLAEYVDLSSRRGKGYNCEGDAWDTDNVSGVQHRVSRLSGIENYYRRDLVEELSTQWVDSLGLNYYWYIQDATDSFNIMKSATTDFTSACNAAYSRSLAIQQLLNTPASDIQDAFDNGIEDGDIIGNIKVNIDLTGPTFSYDILSPNKVSIAVTPAKTTEADLLAAIFADQVYLADPAQYDLFVASPADEGMFLVEHILLRPDFDTPNDSGHDPFMKVCTDGCVNECGIDPYSFRTSVILPGTGERFGNADFRNFMNGLIQAEMPSHIIPRICWVSPCQLEEFEIAWRAFLEARKNGTVTDQMLNELNTLINDLTTIYPSGRLHDCETDDFTGKVILGRSNL